MNPSEPRGTCFHCSKPTGDVRSAYCSTGCASAALVEWTEKKRAPEREFLSWEEDEIAFERAHSPEVFGRFADE